MLEKPLLTRPLYVNIDDLFCSPLLYAVLATAVCARTVQCSLYVSLTILCSSVVVSRGLVLPVFKPCSPPQAPY